MAELEDALDSGSSGPKKPVRVQIPPSAPFFIIFFLKQKITFEIINIITKLY